MSGKLRADGFACVGSADAAGGPPTSVKEAAPPTRWKVQRMNVFCSLLLILAALFVPGLWFLAAVIAINIWRKTSGSRLPSTPTQEPVVSEIGRFRCSPPNPGSNFAFVRFPRQGAA